MLEAFLACTGAGDAPLSGGWTTVLALDSIVTSLTNLSVWQSDTTQPRLLRRAGWYAVGGDLMSGPLLTAIIYVVSDSLETGFVSGVVSANHIWWRLPPGITMDINVWS